VYCPGPGRGFSMQDEQYMDIAFDLAERGRGRTHPNPRVGAVLVRDGQIVGRGFHRGAGTAHAEAAALTEAGGKARGATLYCTLEPCAHFGRTPPCAQAVVAAGVRRVVAALQDPDPRVNGRGFALLRGAGIQVTLLEGRAAQLAKRQNAPFLKAVTRGLPYITYKAAHSLDGKVAAASGDARWISGEQSRQLVHEMRARADAVLVGAGTVRRDDPQLTVRLCEGRDPARVVLSASGDVPLAATLVREAARASTIVLTVTMPPAHEERLLAAGVRVERYGGDVREALQRLATLHIYDVLLEGGPTLASDLFAAGLVDRVAFFVAPLLLGTGAPELVGWPAPGSVAAGLRLRAPAWRQVGEDALLEADVEGA